MEPRLLDYVRCPECGERFGAVHGGTESGRLVCSQGHDFPIRGGIPRFVEEGASGNRVGEVFSREWAYHRLGDPTWNTDLVARVRQIFLEPLGAGPLDLGGAVVLDLGCGNGSQSVAYTAHVREVVAVDVSRGVDLGHAFRTRLAGAHPGAVHFVQADLCRLPLVPRSFDVVHCDAVLHHTADTRASFAVAASYVRPGGALYVWLYRREPLVTPLLAVLRVATTRLPPPGMARLARLLAAPFVVATRILTHTGLRRYPPMARREAALAVMDALAPPYAHWHAPDDVRGWFAAEGFARVRVWNETRKGFGMCGWLPDGGVMPDG